MPKRKRAQVESESEDEPTVRQAAERIGFFDPGIPKRLYTFWRAQVHRGIQNWTCFGAGEAGTTKWAEFCEWAAGQPTMAPRGQLNYHKDSIRNNVRVVCEDIAKKARTSRQNMWEAIQQSRAAYRAANAMAPAHIEPLNWPLPGVEKFGQINTGPSYMPRNPRGSGSAALINATNESNLEVQRTKARGRGQAPQVPSQAVPGSASGVPAGMRQVPVVIPAPSTGGRKNRGKQAGGRLQAQKCRKAAPAGQPAATEGQPVSVKIHIITPEDHTRDAICGGWLFKPYTRSHTVILQIHTMDELHRRSLPYVPTELGAVRRIAHFYALISEDRLEHLPQDAASNFWLSVYIVQSDNDGAMLDVQVEVAPPALVSKKKRALQTAKRGRPFRGKTGRLPAAESSRVAGKGKEKAVDVPSSESSESDNGSWSDESSGGSGEDAGAEPSGAGSSRAAGKGKRKAVIELSSDTDNRSKSDKRSKGGRGSGKGGRSSGKGGRGSGKGGRGR